MINQPLTSSLLNLTCECKVDAWPEVGEVSVVGPVGDAPVYAEPGQHRHHRQGREKEGELDRDEGAPLPGVDLHLVPVELHAAVLLLQ